MASTRVRKVGGLYKDDNFKKLLKQLNGRGIVVVAVLNSNCTECVKLQKFINQLNGGLIHKLPQLVMVYGYNNASLENADDNNDKKSSKAPEKGEEKKVTRLGDTNILDWEELSAGHGYGIFLSEHDVLHYNGEFDHDEFARNILDNLRRFKSSIHSLSGLQAKRQFLENKRTGIIIETSGASDQNHIIDVEDKIKKNKNKLQTKVYFCKGLTQEIALVDKGEVVFKIKGLNFEKFVKKAPKLS